MADNPYKNLQEQAFWSPAVAKRNMLDISDLWTAPFPIGKRSKIATFGSCFAQHFSRALISRGFTWLDAEPAPEGMSKETRFQFNYGVFSARTGNIYTTSLLRQWTEWALGHTRAPEIHWEQNGRIFDPFRPAIEPDGFGSVEEMLVSREATIKAFRDAITTCDVFVFTLGLTESWWDSELEIEYPMCPGTVAGEFDPSRHVFRNQAYPNVRKNLIDAIEMIRKAREKAPKFLLTVSPVPLTATNSGNHVLVATMESKSILRAVAGHVSSSKRFVSYFPSYEIISSPPFRATFFEPNMRSVNHYGVDHVMKTFFAGLPKVAKSGKKHRPTSAGSTREAAFPASSDDLSCEEELLAAFGPAK